MQCVHAIENKITNVFAETPTIAKTPVQHPSSPSLPPPISQERQQQVEYSTASDQSPLPTPISPNQILLAPIPSDTGGGGGGGSGAGVHETQMNEEKDERGGTGKVEDVAAEQEWEEEGKRSRETSSSSGKKKAQGLIEELTREERGKEAEAEDEEDIEPADMVALSKPPIAMTSPFESQSGRLHMPPLEIPVRLIYSYVLSLRFSSVLLLTCIFVCVLLLNTGFSCHPSAVGLS